MGHDIHVRVEHIPGLVDTLLGSKHYPYHAVAWDTRANKRAEGWGNTADEARANAIANLQDKLASR